MIRRRSSPLATLGPRSTLADVAARVGDALRRASIPAVLAGEACATGFAGGRPLSPGLAFVPPADTSEAALDAAMAAAGFRRQRDRYVHPRVRFFVEFPAGPLAIGGDAAIRPVMRRRRGLAWLSLSATDACRDRLAAWYRRNDVHGLGVAVRIALGHRVAMGRIRAWSAREGAGEKFEAFRARLAAARRAARRLKPR